MLRKLLSQNMKKVILGGKWLYGMFLIDLWGARCGMKAKLN